MTWAGHMWSLMWLLILLVFPRKPSLDMTMPYIDLMSFFDALVNGMTASVLFRLPTLSGGKDGSVEPSQLPPSFL